MHACSEYSLGDSKVGKDTVIRNMPWRGVTRSVRAANCGGDSCPHPGEEGAEGTAVRAVHESRQARVPQGETCSERTISKDGVRLLPCSLPAFCFLRLLVQTIGPERAAALSPERRSSERKDEKELGISATA